MIASNDLKAFSLIAKQREYSFGSAVRDLTVVGTLYSLGGDFANSARLNKMADSSNVLFKDLLNDAKSDANSSILGKVAYLSSLTAIAAGYLLQARTVLTTGVVGAASLAILSMMKAGYSSAMTSSVTQQLQAAQALKEKAV
jgi:hypothetical protein